MSEIRLGVVGTGFIGSHLVSSLARHPDTKVGRVLTRRDVHQIRGFPEATLTNSIDDLVSNVDVVVECSGDAIWATDIVSTAIEASLPVVTMNTEFHITVGSHFVGKGLVSEAEGDQPGCLAALHEDAVAMGFTPVVYGNMKGFLNPDPTPSEMAFWGEKQGISLPMVTSFTDGTKVQAEQVLVGNHFGATIAADGMLGASVQDLQSGAAVLVDAATNAGDAITDYIVNRDLPHGVFICATHDESQAAALEYYKMGPGPFYTLIKNNIFVHLEIMKTVHRILDTGSVLLDNSQRPTLSLAAITKRPIRRGTQIPLAIGSFDLRGLAVRAEDHPNHVPIGLIQGAVVSADLDAGMIVESGHVELPESRAVDLWRKASPAQRRSTPDPSSARS